MIARHHKFIVKINLYRINFLVAKVQADYYLFCRLVPGCKQVSYYLIMLCAIDDTAITVAYA